MSAKYVGQVWDLALPQSLAWVLMAMADHADHTGDNVFPGEELLAWKTGYSVRQVRRILLKLEELGIAIPQVRAVGRGNKQRYKLDYSKAARKPDFQNRSKRPVIRDEKTGHQMSGFPAAENADNLTGFDEEKPDILIKENRTFLTGKPDILINITGHSNVGTYKERARVEPSEEPSIEPSVRTNVRSSGQAKPLENPVDAWRINGQGEATEIIADVTAWTPLQSEIAAACLWDWHSATDARKAKIVKISEKLLAVQPTPDLAVIRQARHYYREKNKLDFAPVWIVQDYALIREWCELTGRLVKAPQPQVEPAVLDGETVANELFTLIDGYLADADGDLSAQTWEYLRDLRKQVEAWPSPTPGARRVLARLDEVLETQRAA